MQRTCSPRSVPGTCSGRSQLRQRCLEDPRGLAWSLEMFADLYAAAARATEAARLWGASERLLESVGGQLPPSIGWVCERYLEPMKISSPGGSFDAARAEGR